MKFHPLYAGRFAMGLDNLGPDQPGIIATQSAHKQLASFSQASQIHVKDRHIKGQRRRIEHRRFNEFFMLHASTSPFYPLFASLDVGAQMMKGRSGEVLWDDTIRLGIELRKKMRAIRREFEDKEQRSRPTLVLRCLRARSRRRRSRDGGAPCDAAWEDLPTDELAADARYWELSPDARWHGFTHVAPGYAITDPNKLTLLTPGFDRRYRHLCGFRHSRSGGRPVSARKPRRAGEERPQFTAVPAHARRRIQQGRNTAERPGRFQAAARRQCPPR